MKAYTFSGLVGRIERYENFPSAYFPAKNVDIWLPEDYTNDSQRRYAVLYMHDGQNLFDPALSPVSHEAWRMDLAVSALMHKNKIRPTIVVGIWCNGKERVADYMPEKGSQGIKKVTFNLRFKAKIHLEPRSDDYLRYLVEEIKPMVDRTYATLPNAENTFVMGSSMGGLISLYALCEYPQVFRGAGCLSTHFPIGKGIVLDYFNEHVPAVENHRFYFDYGTEMIDKDYEPYQKKANRILEAHGYTAGEDYLTKKFVGDGHSEIFWQKRVHIPLEFFLK